MRALRYCAPNMMLLRTLSGPVSVAGSTPVMPKPGLCAVLGLIWNRPTSPAAPLAFGLNPLSCRVWAISRSTGMPVAFDASS